MNLSDRVEDLSRRIRRVEIFLAAILGATGINTGQLFDLFG